MNDFRNGGLDVLISTSVIEVGVDIPNASVMLIEDADRFGLSQLHQLRGRIGRGEHKSYCILFADLLTEEGKERMRAITEYTDGFKLAEADLEIRGEGQLFGPRQSGLPDLKLAKLTRDIKVLNCAREEAFRIIESDSLLEREEHRITLKEIKTRFASSLDWLFNA
jgi:ATP-dependent DNA helicase RecG